MSKPGKNNSLFRELWDFLSIRKKWWLLPCIVILFLIGALIVIGQATALSPFIYVLF